MRFIVKISSHSLRIEIKWSTTKSQEALDSCLFLNRDSSPVYTYNTAIDQIENLQLCKWTSDTKVTELGFNGSDS